MQAIRILAVAAVMLVASTAGAQGGQGAQGGGRMSGEEMQRRQNEMLFKDITLSDAPPSVRRKSRLFIRVSRGDGKSA